MNRRHKINWKKQPEGAKKRYFSVRHTKEYWAAEKERLKEAGKITPKPVRGAEKLLQVQTDYFTAGAIWQKIYGIWSCTKPAPILHWMRGMTPEQAKAALLRMDAKWQWIFRPDVNASQASWPKANLADPGASRGGARDEVQTNMREVNRGGFTAEPGEGSGMVKAA